MCAGHMLTEEGRNAVLMHACAASAVPFCSYWAVESEPTKSHLPLLMLRGSNVAPERRHCCDWLFFELSTCRQLPLLIPHAVFFSFIQRLIICTLSLKRRQLRRSSEYEHILATGHERSSGQGFRAYPRDAR